MFKFKILATGFLTMVLGAGVAVGVAATNQHTVDRVDAETIQSPNGKRAILWEDNWTKASKGMYIHYWGGSESSDWNSKPKMLKSEKKNSKGQYIYYYNIPSDSQNFLIYYTTDNQQTPDIAVSSFNTNNCGYWVWDNKVTYGSYSCTSLTGKIVYNSNTTTSETKEATFYWGKSYTVVANTFSNPGYTFVGWNSSADGSGTEYSQGDVFYTPAETTINLYAIWAEATYEVNEYNVLDGAVEEEAFRTGQRQSGYAPVQSELAGYIKNGIYTDAACTKEFDGTLNANTNLYHSYISKTYDYIYISGLDDDHYSNGTSAPTSVNLYTWKQEGEINTPLNGGWPGNEIVLADYVCNGTNFNARGLYRIPFCNNDGSDLPTNFIVHTSYSGGEKQSIDLSLTIGNYYNMNILVKNSADLDNSAAGGSAELGAQAALIWKIRDAMLGAGEYVYEDKTYTQSVCAIDRVTANEILDEYDALSSKAVIDEATIWTNNVDDRKDGQGNVQASGNYTGLEIITSLRTMHSTPESELRMVLSNASESPVMLITIIATISAVLFAMIIVIKRRKQSSK